MKYWIIIVLSTMITFIAWYSTASFFLINTFGEGWGPILGLVGIFGGVSGIAISAVKLSSQEGIKRAFIALVIFFSVFYIIGAALSYLGGR